MTTMTHASSSLLVAHASDSCADLQDAPITAADVLDGRPLARSLPVGELGDGMSVWLWDCTAGRFRWHFGECDEIVHIVAGSVTVTDQDGGVVYLETGDIGCFAAGTWAIWDVEEYVKKVAVTRRVAGDPLSRLVRALRRLAKRMLGRGAR